MNFFSKSSQYFSLIYNNNQLFRNYIHQACTRERFCVGFVPLSPYKFLKPTHERGTKMTHIYKPDIHG